MSRVRFQANLVNGNPFRSEDFRFERGDDLIPLVRIRDIKSTNFETFIDKKDVPNEFLIRDGDLVIGMDGDFNSVIWDRGPAALNQRMCLLRSSDEQTTRFISYAVPHQLKMVNELSYATTVKHLSSQQVLDLWLPDISRRQQHAIADYLDRETAEIDAMTADLDKMEALLTERRSAVLTSTISRLSVKWPMPKLGTLVQMVSGSGFPHRLQGQEGKELPFYKVGSLSMTGSDGTIVDDRNSISREDAATLRARVIPGGSVLLAKIGAALLLGRFVRNAKPCCIDNNMLALIPSPKVDAKFLEHALSMVDINVLERSGPVPTLDLGGLRQHRVPLPPLEEQHRIVDVIDRETAEIDAMLADITELRDLLAERRAALIAAAVTGQIDIPTAEEPTHA